MSNHPIDTADVIPTFSRLPWHDSKLLGLRVGGGSSSQLIVSLDLDFRKVAHAGGRTEIQFVDSRGVHADIDLLAKRLCSHAIASGHCERARNSRDFFVQRINERFDLYPGETTDGLFLFALTLIHPAGEVLVLARSFSLSADEPYPGTR